MTEKEFINSISNSKEDVLQQFFNLLKSNGIDYCVVGGLAVNAYVEPVVSLDLDVVVTMDKIVQLRNAAKDIFAIEEFPHSLNFASQHSDLRIQIQIDPRYQSFISHAQEKEVMGYTMKVAVLEDILQGKIWAYSDEERRASKRQKDLADIFRLIEAYPELRNSLPESLKDVIK